MYAYYTIDGKPKMLHVAAEVMRKADDPYAAVVARIPAGAQNVEIRETPKPRPIEKAKNEAKRGIDELAGFVRASYVSSGPLIDYEYRMAEADAREYLTSLESPPGVPVPLSVQAWADSKSIDTVTAAHGIIDAASRLYTALNDIRSARLAGKAAIDAAQDEMTIDAERKRVEEALEALRR